MAKTFTEEERRKLTEQVLNYALETHAPYKDIAKKFGVSVATVSDYISNSSVIDSTTGKTLKEFYIVKSGRLASKNIQGIERVYSVFNQVLDGNTLEQIAKEYDVSASAISRDINERLNKYSAQKCSLAKKVLKLNRLSNVQKIDDIPFEHFKLSTIEKKIMICASAYVTGNTLDSISEYYNAKEEDIIGSFCDVLDSLDWALYERVQDKLFQDGYITKKNTLKK